MPTTRAARRAARCLTEVLPADALGLVLYQLPLAHDIAEVAPTCHALCDAAKLAQKLRPFSDDVVALQGHAGALYGVAALPDGRVITSSFDKTLKLWRDGACVRTINAHTGLIWSVKALPDGRFLTGSVDRTAKLWQPDGTLERTFEIGKIVLCIAVLPDGVHVALGVAEGSDDEACGEIWLYHVDGTLVHKFEGHSDEVWSVAVTPDGQHIISGSEDETVKVWSVASKSLVSTCREHSGRVAAVAATPDSQRILSGAEDFTVQVWLLDGTHESTFDELHDEGVNDLVALPDNQHALSASNDGTVQLFNINDGAVLRTFKHFDFFWSCVTSLALLPDGLRFVSGGADDTVRIFEHGLVPLSA